MLVELSKDELEWLENRLHVDLLEDDELESLLTDAEAEADQFEKNPDRKVALIITEKLRQARIAAEVV